MRTPRIVFLASVMGLVMTGRCPRLDASPLDPTPGYAAIQQAFLREEFDHAAMLAKTFVMEHPDGPEASRVGIWLALSLDRLQRSHEALEALDQVKSHLSLDDPLWPEVLFWEGDVSRRAFQMVRAKSAYQRLLIRYPDSTWSSQAQLGLGLVYLHQQAYALAIGHFHEVTLRQLGTPVANEALLLEGVCHLRLREFPEGIEVLRFLVSQLQDPSLMAQAAFYLGESFSGLARYEEAIQAYLRAVSIARASPWSEVAQFGLGWAYYHTGRCEESIRTFEQYAKHGEGADHETEALFAQASCLMRLGRESEGLLRFEQILSREPEHPLALESGLLLADTYRRQNRLALAKELLHTLLRPTLSSNARAQIQLRLGRIALEQGNATQASTIFSLAAEQEDPLVQQAALNGMGDVQRFLGDVATAQQWYEDAVGAGSETPQADYARYQLGRLALQAGAFEQALDHFRMLTTSSDHALADEARLALVLAYLGQHELNVARGQVAAIRRSHAPASLKARASYYEALLALEQGDLATARRLCEGTLVEVPETEEAFEAHFVLADLKARETSVAEASAWLRSVFAPSILPRTRRGRLAKWFGDTARADGAYAEAIRWYDEAAEFSPALAAETAYRIASCYEEGADVDAALVWYERAMHQPWRVRGQLAAAKLLERQEQFKDAEAIYETLASESIPEATMARERLATLREPGSTH